jgi:hypothetical protein
MSLLERRRSPVYRQVEAYEESWKRDHDAVAECWGWEDTIAVGISTGSLIERVERSWRDRVFRGVEDYCEEANTFFRALLDLWLRITDQVLAEATQLEKTYASVEGAMELREIEERLRNHLSAWQPPRLSMAVGLREMTLTPEAAAELDRLIEEAKKNPPPMPAGPIPQEMSGEEFSALMRRQRP